MTEYKVIKRLIPPEATHWLLCKQGLGRSYYYYNVPCVILKRMDDTRTKVRVLTDRCGSPCDRIRYIETRRLECMKTGNRVLV